MVARDIRWSLNYVREVVELGADFVDRDLA